MKYYRYLSGSKVDMLFPQVPHVLREKVSAGIGFNLGVVSGSVGSEAARFDDHVTRLQVVERHLRASNSIGTIRKPLDWFEGEMEALTASFWTRAGAVFFVGETPRKVVMLGGSATNLLGAKGSSSEGPPFSELSAMLGALEAFVSRDVSGNTEMPPVLMMRVDEGRIVVNTWADLASYVASDQRNWNSRECVHFLARKLAVGETSHGVEVLLGTPLYVAAGKATEN